MAVSGLWEWMRGYVIIKVTGRMLERFVNAAASQHIDLSDLVRVGEGAMMARVSLRGYLQLRPLLSAFGCRASVEMRGGAPFIVSAAWRRKAMVVGIVLFAVALYGLSSVVWTIDMTGVSPERRARIVEVLERLGVRRWVRRSSIDIDFVRDELARSVDGLAWAGVELQGTTLVVRGADMIMPQRPVGHIDLVASSDAVIERLIVLAGEARVREGETVVSGQVLVAGRAAAVPGEQPVHARAIIRGRVWREFRARTPLEIEERIRTGKSSARYLFTIGALRFAVGRRGAYDAYDTEELVRRVRIGRGGPFDVEITREVRHELSLGIGSVTRAEAFALAREEAASAAQRAIPSGAERVSVLEESVDELGDDLSPSAVSVCLIVETIEDIALMRDNVSDERGE
ncbi:MAG: sporulation protein YqfD [Clostridia bacterium]|nr:sporulation protein YqfD [Clostridia bacterium]